MPKVKKLETESGVHIDGERRNLKSWPARFYRRKKGFWRLYYLYVRRAFQLQMKIES